MMSAESRVMSLPAPVEVMLVVDPWRVRVWPVEPTVNAPDGVIEVNVPEMPPVPLKTKLLIVLVAVAPEIAPDRPSVVTLETAPALMETLLIVFVVAAEIVLASVRAPAEVILFEELKN